MTRQAGAGRRGLPPGPAGIPAQADKRFRRSDVRLGRGRSWRAGLVRAAVFGAAGLLVLVLVVWSGSALMDASTFKIKRVVVRGNARLSSGDVRALLDGIDTESIFRVDLEAYRLRVLDSPWVATAALWRVFPSTVEVRVAERSPLAIARLNGQLYLVDAMGVIIDSYGPQYREFDLPIVDGLLVDGGNGGGVDAQRIQLTERLLGELSSQPDLFRRISQVDVSDPRNAVVLLDGEPARLLLGDREFLERLRLYQEAAEKIRDQVAAVDYYEPRRDRVVVGPARGVPDASKTGPVK